MSIKRIINKIKKIFAFFLFRIFSLLKIKNNKILIMNYNGKGFGDNAKYIVEKLLKDIKKYDIVWTTNNTSSLPDGIRNVKPESLKWIYEMCTSKIWINNCRFKPYVRKRKRQYYIQTWHSSLRLKKIELDAKETLGKYYLKMMEVDSKMINLMISGSDFSYNIYSKSFLYDGEIKMIGTPRCDLFFDNTKMNNIKKKIYKFYNIDLSQKIILYAPTFRNNTKTDFFMDLNYIHEKIKDGHVLMVRLHPNTKMNLKNYKNIIDVTKYPDMQELICAIDMLITDYSGCCFDMMYTKKPCILFVKDIEDYLKRERGMYFEIDKLPFFKAKTEEELIDLIYNFDYKKYMNNIIKFEQKIGLHENGNASSKMKEVIDKVIEEGYNGKKI